MATIHKEFNEFNNLIKLGESKKQSLYGSRDAIKAKITAYFKDKMSVTPEFKMQGSFAMNTVINPIPVAGNGRNLFKYDLDYGIYLPYTDYRPQTLQNWIFEAVDGHTSCPTERKSPCVRVNFVAGHHLDLPIYRKRSNGLIELAHSAKGWMDSDPSKVIDWFNGKKRNNTQLTKIVRYAKAWKNQRETLKTHLDFPSGFELTFLISQYYVKKAGRDDLAFFDTMRAIHNRLNGNFRFIDPVYGGDLFGGYSSTRKADFLGELKELMTIGERAMQEQNFRVATDLLKNYLGDRFPNGRNANEKELAKDYGNKLASSKIQPKPYA